MHAQVLGWQLHMRLSSAGAAMDVDALHSQYYTICTTVIYLLLLLEYHLLPAIWIPYSTQSDDCIVQLLSVSVSKLVI